MSIVQRSAVAAVMGFFMVVVMSACTKLTVPDTFKAQLLVQQSTLRVIQDDPARAERVLEITAQIRPDIEADTVALGLLDEAVREQINWERLTIADAMLLDSLLIEARNQLELRFGTGLLDPEARESIARVLDWVDNAAELVKEVRGAD